MASKRIADEPAYVLHRYDWSETSLILEVFTRHHGRVALVAKGAKRPTSSFRPVLLPLQPLSLVFGVMVISAPSNRPNGWAVMSCPRARRCCRVITSMNC